MRIAEISSRDHCPTATDHQTKLLFQIETSIADIERHSPQLPLSDTHTANLRLALTHLTSLSPFHNNSVELQIWKLSYRLWNACVDHSNSSSSSAAMNKLTEQHASLHQFTADLLFIAADVASIPSPMFKNYFCVKIFD